MPFSNTELEELCIWKCYTSQSCHGSNTDSIQIILSVIIWIRAKKLFPFSSCKPLPTWAMMRDDGNSNSSTSGSYTLFNSAQDGLESVAAFCVPSFYLLPSKVLISSSFVGFLSSSLLGSKCQVNKIVLTSRLWFVINYIPHHHL